MDNKLYSKLLKQLKKPLLFVRLQMKLFIEVIYSNPLRIILIVVLDIIGAGSRIAVLGVISVMVSAFQDPRTVTYWNMSFDLSPTKDLLMLVSALLFVILFSGAIASFSSVWLSRKQGRVCHTNCLDLCEKTLEKPPSHLYIPPYLPDYGLNKLLTQICMHKGLATETLLRMIYPIILMFLSISTIFYLNPKFTFFVIILGIILVPIYFFIGMKVHKNSQGFYDSVSANMGVEVAKYSSSINNQYGIVNTDNKETLNPEKNKSIKIFMDAWDKNLLANNIVSFSLSLLSSFFLPAIILYIGYMVLDSQMSPNYLITFAGAFFYMVSALQTVSSYGTNLLRYFPQLYRNNEFVSQGISEETSHSQMVNNWPTELVFQLSGNLLSGSSLEGKVGTEQRVGLYTGQPLIKMTLDNIIDPLVESGIILEEMLHNFSFINGSYQFSKGTLEDNLLGTLSGDAAKEKLNNVLKHFNEISDDLENLNTGLQMKMSSEVWETFTASEKSALKLLPLMIQEKPQLIFLDAAIMNSYHPDHYDHIFRLLEGNYLFIVFTSTEIAPKIAELFIIVGNCKVMGLGNRGWFDKVSPHLSSTRKGSTDSGLDSTLV